MAKVVSLDLEVFYGVGDEIHGVHGCCVVKAGAAACAWGRPYCCTSSAKAAAATERRAYAGKGHAAERDEEGDERAASRY